MRNITIDSIVSTNNNGIQPMTGIINGMGSAFLGRLTQTGFEGTVEATVEGNKVIITIEPIAEQPEE